LWTTLLRGTCLQCTPAAAPGQHRLRSKSGCGMRFKRCAGRADVRRERSDISLEHHPAGGPHSILPVD
jgi:hypothetical protein